MAKHPSAASSTKKTSRASTIKKPDQYFSRAVGKALDALAFIGQSPQPVSLNEISRYLNLTKASAFRLVYTLEALGYLAKSANAKYSVRGRTLAHVSTRQVNDMLRYGSEALEALSMEFRETASLAALFENHIEVIAVVESAQMIRMGNTVGRIVPPHASSLGKAITAFQPHETRLKLLRSYGTAPITPATLTDEMALRQEFARIVECGYAEDREESVAGGWCFAAPVIGDGGTAYGAVSLSMPILRLPPKEGQANIIAAVRRAAAQIQARCSSEGASTK